MRGMKVSRNHETLHQLWITAFMHLLSTYYNIPAPHSFLIDSVHSHLTESGGLNSPFGQNQGPGLQIPATLVSTDSGVLCSLRYTLNPLKNVSGVTHF